MSAYSLIVEAGTGWPDGSRRGELPMPDDDVVADRYGIAEDMLDRGRDRMVRGVELGPRSSGRCQHNLLYWTGGDWWGVGPGAHSHVGGTRWWNVKHPAAYAGRLAGDSARPPRARCSPPRTRRWSG